MMKIKVLGSGCSKCEALLAATKEAVQHLGIDARIEYVTDFAQIARYGVMSTPALVVDEKVVSAGRVLKAGQIESLLKSGPEKHGSSCAAKTARLLPFFLPV